MRQIPTESSIFVVRLCFLALISFAIYVITVPISIPSPLGLGEIRVIIIVVVGRILEEGFIDVARKLVKAEAAKQHA